MAEQKTPIAPPEAQTVKATGDAWGDDISEERQRELDAILAAWDAEADHGERTGPFDREDLMYGTEDDEPLTLTGADVFYLAARSITAPSEPAFHNLDIAREVLRDPVRSMTVNLSGVRLERANLNGANLTGANLSWARLARAGLMDAQLLGANLQNAQLTGAEMPVAQLTGADLIGAQLSGADLSNAQLVSAKLMWADLTGANLQSANLENADLRSARLNSATRLNQAILMGASFDQVTLDSANLTVVSWEDVSPLGDDRRANSDILRQGLLKLPAQRISDHEAAVRANRLLATALRAQGLAEDADIFAYRAQVMQRGLRLQRRQFGRWGISWFFAALSGYGYRLGNIFVAYGLVLAVFAAIFWALGVHSFAAEPGWQALWDSFLVSLSAIHGRATFETLGAWSPAAWVAAVESVIGIIIEGVFVAMIIQRLFR